MHGHCCCSSSSRTRARKAHTRLGSTHRRVLSLSLSPFICARRLPCRRNAWSTQWEREHEDDGELVGEEELDSLVKRSLMGPPKRRSMGLRVRVQVRYTESGERTKGFNFIILELQLPSAFPWRPARRRSSRGSHARSSCRRWTAMTKPTHGNNGRWWAGDERRRRVSSSTGVTEPPLKWGVCLPRSYRGILDEARMRKHTQISIQYQIWNSS
jgi:hypothetical protein